MRLFSSEKIPSSDRRLAGERQILLNRAVIGVVTTLICIYLQLSTYIIAAFGIYLGINTLLMLGRLTAVNPRIRWLMAIVLDAVMATAIQLHDPEGMAFVYPILIWSILGNGFRYGTRWLCIASIANFLSFAVVLASAPYWQGMPVLAASLLFGLLILPAYCSKLVSSLWKATNQAEAANRAKTHFLASVSHELRTPLNAIIGYGSQLAEEDLTPRIHGMVASSHHAAEHLLYLIDQLLYASRSEKTQATAEQIDFTLPDLVVKTREIVLLQAADKGVSVHCHAAPGSDRLLNGPADMLRNMMVNLASNAVKFTDEGRVVIECGLESGAMGHQLWFAISDSGIGIADDARQRIFEPFTQADATVAGRFGGTGLGLSICQQMATQMGGTLEVESDLGVGSRFIYRGPVHLADHQISQQSEQSILLLSPENRPAIATDAAGVAIEWIACSNAEQLVDLLPDIDLPRYDIVVIDESILETVQADSELWPSFEQAKIPVVLQRSTSALELDDIRLRAAFASIIPDQADFSTLRSAARIGTSFRTALPEESTEPSRHVAQLAAHPRRVLVADDNRTNREVVKTILETAGHRVDLAVDGEDALAALERQTADLVFLDVNMPKMSGIEVCAMWRQIEGPRAHVPILGLTADATEETEKLCLDAGMDARLTKPIRRDQLLEVIEQYCPIDESCPAPVSTDPLGKVVSLNGDALAQLVALDRAQVDDLLDMGGLEFLASLAESYAEDVHKLLHDLQLAVSRGDLEKFRFAAHAIKSSAANMGASTLSALCHQMEVISAPDFRSEGSKLVGRTTELATMVEQELAQLTAGTSAAA